MNFYKFLENPKIYNFIEKTLSLGNKSCLNCLGGLIKPKEDNLLLDVGCGTGKYAKLFSKNYYGVDINEDYINYAKGNYNGNFDTMDATDLRFSDNTFDFIFNVSLFHHLSDESIKTAINEMKRVCKNNGKILIIDAVFPSKKNFLGYLLFKLDRGKHTRKLKDLNNLLSRYNLKLIQDNIKGSFPYRFAVFMYQKP